MIRPLHIGLLATITSLLLLSATGKAFAGDLTRPQCTPEQRIGSLCFDANMPQAVEKTRTREFQAAFDSVVSQAQAYLDAQTPSPTKVVLTDLDETLVSNLTYFDRTPGWTQEGFQAWLKSRRHGPYFPAVRQLLLNAKARGFKVIFITGRPATLCHETLRQTRKIPWDGIFFKPGGLSMPGGNYKTQMRNALRALGYEIVLNIGDQLSDFDLPVDPQAGEFLLPNVLYASE